MTGDRISITRLKAHADSRGIVFESLEPERLSGWLNTHTVISVPGAIRGNHRHLRGTEITAVVGPALVRYRDGAVTRDVDVPSGEVWRFEFPPGVAHAFRNTGDRAAVLVSFNSERHDPSAPDMERVELL